MWWLLAALGISISWQIMYIQNTHTQRHTHNIAVPLLFLVLVSSSGCHLTYGFFSPILEVWITLESSEQRMHSFYETHFMKCHNDMHGHSPRFPQLLHQLECFLLWKDHILTHWVFPAPKGCQLLAVAIKLQKWSLQAIRKNIYLFVLHMKLGTLL